MSIALFDPSIVSSNLGDQIIIDSVIGELSKLMPFDQIINIPTQEIISGVSIKKANDAKVRFVGGTNLLSSHMMSYRQWKIDLIKSYRLHDVTLMGVGWWQYQNNPDIYTRTILRNVLSKSKMHSTRDEYTKNKLKSIGINNVINTGCPTMWRLSPEHCYNIGAEKSESVIFTLTDYHKDPINDIKLINLLKSRYGKVYYWPQGSGDLSYLRSLGDNGIITIKPSLFAYDSILRGNDSIDFVGTRLHGGVRAMQNFRRALIIVVDNRAKEISLDTGLPIAERSDMDTIKNWIDRPSRTEITMKWDIINEWKSQFLG